MVKKVIAVDAGEEEKGAACDSRGQRGAYKHFTPKKRFLLGKGHCSHSLPMAVNLALLDSVKGSYIALLSCLSY